MGEAFLLRRGSGMDASDATAATSDILTGKTAYIDDSGESKTGTMQNNGAISRTLNCGSIYTIPVGYHNGSGTISANSLSSQTSATAVSTDILSGKTAYVNGAKLTGTIPSIVARTITPGRATQTISAGNYLSGTQTIQGDTNLNAGNIKNGVSIFGIIGNLGGLEKKQIEGLSTARYDLAAVTIGDYALFAGGSPASSVVDSYTSTLVRNTATSLSVARSELAATMMGVYALFAGGKSSSKSSVVDAYSATLVRSTATNLSSTKSTLAATSVGGYALFAGEGSVDAYSGSFVRTTLEEVSFLTNNLAAATVGDFGIFRSKGMCAYNKSLVRTFPPSIYGARTHLAATTVGDYALFAGGEWSEVYSSEVEGYNKSLTRTIAPRLSAGRKDLAATTVGDYALFAGGSVASNGYSSVVDSYNNRMIRSTTTDLSLARSDLAATTIGDHALFAGGFNAGTKNIVDAYYFVN